MSIPASFVMSNGENGITVSTNSSGGGSKTLNNSGNHTFFVGGTMPVSATKPIGTYRGSFTVSVNYN